jgi:membrane protease YdiL (CAAX protease family)
MIPFKGIIKDLPVTGSLIALLGITAFSFLISTTVTLLITKGEVVELNHLRIAQLIQSFGIFIIPSLFFAYLKHGNMSEWLKLNRLPNLFMLVAGILAIVVAIPVVNRMISLNEMIVFPEALKGFERMLLEQEQNLKEITEKMLLANSISELVRNILLMAMLPALGEELFFRGGLQNILREKLNPHVAVLLTALIFSIFHMQFYGIIPRFFLGAVLGYLFLYSGNIWVPVIAHFANNALAIVFHYLQENKLITFNPETPGRDDGFVLVLFSFILVVSVIFLIASRQRSSKPGL